MSLRIKIPPANASIMDESAPAARGKNLNRNKRRVTAVYSDDENEEEDARPSPSQKKTKYTEAHDDYDEDIDVDGNGLSSRRSSKSPVSHKRLTKKKQEDNFKSKKPRAVVEDSEDEFEADVVSDDLSGNADDYEDDADFIDDTPKKGKGKDAVKRKGGKEGGKGVKSSKAKARAESQEKEIIVKDERQGINGEVSSSKIRIKASLDTVSTPEAAADSASQDPDKSEPQKKRKLPPIKKNKSLPSGTPATSSTGPSKPAPSITSAAKPTTTATTAEGVPASPVTPATRVPAALQGADFNLQDRSVYNMLFKPSGSTPRSGGREERRKNLDSLREADKARRALEAKHSFDLQAQMDKISAFEDRLRRAHSSVLFPNILGAKMREVFELERKRREPQEEGEMPSSWYVESGLGDLTLLIKRIQSRHEI